ncbi:MAG TPA: Phenylacetic acid catabolic protein [Longimicrobiaceae bacterium]|nr:Phenylacetic acid catabolic protein [Longimicrobiaceae bacterium]
MSTVAAPGTAFERADALPGDVRAPLRDLILVLADSKRLLGIRYSDWMLGAPSLEAGISASSMAQDEWGHGRLTYALLGEFGDEPKALEHEREASEYRNPEALDRPVRSWSELVALALLVDTALAVQYEALVDSRYTPVRNRVQKLLDEEAFHFQYAAGWARGLGKSAQVRGELRDAVASLLPQTLRWFGRAEAAERLVQEGIVRARPDALRERFLSCIGPVLQDAGLAGELGVGERDGRWSWSGEIGWEGWDDTTRRAGGSGPDEETIARVRGDKNRALLMD